MLKVLWLDVRSKHWIQSNGQAANIARRRRSEKACHPPNYGKPELWTNYGHESHTRSLTHWLRTLNSPVESFLRLENELTWKTASWLRREIRSSSEDVLGLRILFGGDNPCLIYRSLPRCPPLCRTLEPWKYWEII